MAKKTKAAPVGDAGGEEQIVAAKSASGASGEELVVATVPAPAACDAAPTESKPAKRPKRTPVTLATLAERYLAALEAEGKSDGTLFSYRLEIRSALAELGEETLLADLTPERVTAFFACDRVTKTRTGRAKSPLSIAKTIRVLTQALVYAEEEGLMKKAPLPEESMPAEKA